MSVYLYRWGKLAYRRKWIVLAIWLVGFLSLGALSGVVGGKFKDDFTIPGMPSERATKILDEQFPGFSDEFKFDAISGTYVIKAPDGQKITSPENKARVEAVVNKLSNFNTNHRDQLNYWVGVADKLPQDQQDKNAQLIRELKESQEKFKDNQAGLKVDPAKKLQNPITAAEEMGCLTGDRTSQEFISKCSNAPVNVLNKTNPDTVVTLAANFKATLKDGKPATIMELTQADRDAVFAIGDQARKEGMQVEIAGPVAMEQTMPGGVAELLGFLVAFVVMVVAFGALIAAFVPLITAIVGLGAAMTLITIGAGLMEIPSFTTFLCSMVGIALSIDYALFIVSRYKHELHVCDTPEEAAGKAVGTAGTAVVFAGLTVIIALSGLAIVNIRFLTFMGLGGALAAAFAVLVAITLMPALLGLFGRFLFKPKIPGVAKYDPEDDTHVTNGMRVGKLIGRFPAVILGLAVVLLGLLALPALNLSLGMPGEDALPETTTTRKAYELRTTAFGEGSNGTLMVAVSLTNVPQDQRDAALKALQEKLGQNSEMDYVTNPMRNKIKGADPQDKNAPDGDGALIYGVPKHGPNNKDTKELVKNARNAEQELKDAYGIEYGITGSTAIYADIDHAMLSKIAPYMAVVAGAAFLLLILVFRSILVPLTAALGFLLSMAATFGATVLIFQEGRLGIISDPHPIVSFMPIMLIGLVFGLAMDYQVFLVTRMREEYVHGKNPKDAMISGYHHGARVVTSAAIIMISVFSAFILESDVTVKSMGFALAVAVLLDAFVVRMVIMPALLALLGKWAWWIPSWLDKILPDIDIEGSKLADLQAAAKRPAAEPSLAK